MQPTAYSRTADVTAAIRAAHLIYDHPKLFEDPYALALTSPLWRTVCRHRWLHDLVIRGALAGLRPVHGWILVRDRLTDERLQQFIADGGDQFVVLGAGFDTTALRRPPWLGNTRIFEVDHPATQAVKLNRLARNGFGRDGREPITVAMDFERDNLASVLSGSSFGTDQRAFFAWQGVVYYLTAAAIRETLDSVARLAAPGSELLFDFLLPRTSLPRTETRVQSLADFFTSRLGERYISYHTPDDVTALLDDAGFDVVAIDLDEALEQTYCAARADGLTVMRGFGIAHARRRG